MSNEPKTRQGYLTPQCLQIICSETNERQGEPHLQQQRSTAQAAIAKAAAREEASSFPIIATLSS
jgi:hypothetical protein